MRYDSPTRLMYMLWFHHFQAFLEDHPGVGCWFEFSHGVVNFGMASPVFFLLFFFVCVGVGVGVASKRIQLKKTHTRMTAKVGLCIQMGS